MRALDIEALDVDITPTPRAGFGIALRAGPSFARAAMKWRLEK